MVNNIEIIITIVVCASGISSLMSLRAMKKFESVDSLWGYGLLWMIVFILIYSFIISIIYKIFTWFYV